MKDVIVIEDKAKCKSMMTLPFFISVNLIAALTPMLIVLCWVLVDSAVYMTPITLFV